ncbi:sulfur carrier protein ThiS [Nesterenkonia sp. MY13]|uniref:Sulfur carrier protein ThiS n=1 Tax=Nesterenkonia sedimenti TaxID=1463632 RepID=A0A7X8TLI7_9MICC|nr:sulfur carrier protein ThiS [Nesterenkonia sedimenti]NLS10908.1 sulfur carrier protein ThiS [Nesterenkonia sedimenti]
MPTVRINDENVTFNEGATVVDAVAQTTGRELTAEGKPADGGRLGVAVALAEEVVPRSRWAGVELSEGDQLEIVTAVQGG